MVRGFFAAALWCASAWASACPLCLGAFQQSEAQELVAAAHAVLAVPTADPGRFRVIEVVKGARPPSATVEGGYPRNGPAFEAAGSRSGKALLLIRDDAFPTWTILGAIGADHLGWLRKVAAGKPAAQLSLEDWRARLALVLPYLESPEPLAAEFAADEFAAAPYAALRTVKQRLSAAAIRSWLKDQNNAGRRPLYLLLLGIAGNGDDAKRLETQLELASQTRDPTNLAPMLAADLELRGAARMTWVDVRYMGDRQRSSRELEAALLALSVQGNTNAAVPRARVIQSYRLFTREHPEIAGFVAPDLAAWQYWDAVPEYVALMKSSTPQQYPSRIAIVTYLRQSPGGRSIDLPASEVRVTESTAATAFPMSPHPARPQ